MAGLVKTLTRWSKAPARDVEAPTGAWVNMIRGLAARATTPLLPDDYLSLLNPLWSARELRGEIVEVRAETDDSATVIIRPGWGFATDYRPGQYVGIGLRVKGRWHWRSYSLTSVPEQAEGEISITVKATPEGFLSTHLVDGVEPGTIIRLAAPQGEFILPDPPPDKILFLTAGSGITPVMAMLRSLRARGQQPDIVHVHSAPSEDSVIFAKELRELENEQRGYRLHLQLTQRDGKLDFDNLDEIASDWRERSAWVCGPTAMLDAAEKTWEDHDIADHLNMERFTIAATDKGGEGGTVVFMISDKSAEIDGATTILQAGEDAGIQMPFGCRMGICQTCVLPLEEGHVRDIRSGQEHGAGDRIQTCVSTASGNCTIKI
ncbi:flavodoxin reductase family protein [Mycolicibacterium chubuense NBB4]|uniref:Flavodoxin reductase family protein n=1 Tax=Mycolicibacterium chubuense (strain NBB4) TaxID=710421 RepID=I4BFA5_MYCCN|nr:ferredoxin reductase [Mycolicibacterium chubuense]AFM15962.1 flavodoxin reductase family protein [Mycolicibacterium chubuense NBB4]